ncbi:MAG: AAA family ATPase [Paludibacteraceae bacterium]|nr:AAA family ATPase [Paludibacteraceae bacterium]
MLTDFIISQIRAELPFEPNEEKYHLLKMLGDFLVSRDTDRLFLLQGYAGTGKTSMMAAMVRALNRLQQKTVLLAPTGRAAKVLSAYSGFPAYTIHKQIYRQKDMGTEQFGLSYNSLQDTLFIVDEASMISNGGQDGVAFGTGRLLSDLIEYVYSGRNCVLFLIGDTAQLPPVGQENSPALDKNTLECYGLKVTDFVLTQVARQALESGILFNATTLRNRLNEGKTKQVPQFLTDGFADIHKITGEEMLEDIEKAYREVGQDQTMVVVRTNKRMNLYNQGIRNRILWREDLLTASDRIMVTKNNYFWTRQYEGIDFLANGDIFEVERLRGEREIYGFRFVDASLKALDYDWEIDCILCLDTLLSESPEQNYQMQRELFEKIALDYPEIHSRKELVKTIMENPYYNALHIKHAYAVTCHKAQGGQWKRVFVDQGVINDEQLGTDYYRWLYTALTRATEDVYLINF